METEDGGDPATKERARLRRQCSPKGPCGYLLESIHLQAAVMDSSYRIKQVNQQTIDLVNGPAQQVVPLTTRMAVRNRTKRAEGKRAETKCLYDSRNEWQTLE